VLFFRIPAERRFWKACQHQKLAGLRRAWWMLYLGGMEKTQIDGPSMTTKVRFPILVAKDPEAGKWIATSLLTGAVASSMYAGDAYRMVADKVREQFEAEGTGRKGWSPKLDEAPQCAFRDWVIDTYWPGSDTFHARELVLELPLG
jgi:hypothetical protein